MIFYIPYKYSNSTNIKNFTALNDGYSIRFMGGYDTKKPFGYLYRRNLSSETLIIDDSKLTKIDHGLTISDINPKDRQNFSSCIKLISDDLSKILKDNTCGWLEVYLESSMTCPM